MVKFYLPLLAHLKKARKMRRGRYGACHYALLLVTHHSIYNTSAALTSYTSPCIYPALFTFRIHKYKKALVSFICKPHEKEHQDRKFLWVLTIYYLSYWLGLIWSISIHNKSVLSLSSSTKLNVGILIFRFWQIRIHWMYSFSV